MASPIPPVPLNDPCSVIFNNVLYVYTADAFQSLPLEKGGKWAQLENGVSVSGATCVLGANNGIGSSDAMWVVGGVANSSMSQYPGLQKYSFSSRKWSSIMPKVTVTAGRQNHATAFLEQTASILVYAGGQDGSTLPSSDTFVISTQPPYEVDSFGTHINPPVTSPLLLAWTGNQAITLGGDPSNKDIFLFDAVNGWQSYGTKLQTGMQNSQYIRATLIRGDDNSKVLQVYDVTTSPNQVSEIVLQDPNGHPAKTGEEVGQPSSHSHSRKRKRKLTLKSWPAYNATNAPTGTRQGCSIAQDPDGIVVLAGGNSQNPVAMFDPETNSWYDTKDFFGAQNIKQQAIIASKLQHETQSSTNTHTGTSATSSSTSSPVASSGGLSPETKTILGVVLGSILGAIALLFIILLLLWWRRSSKKNKWQRKQYEEDEKQRMSFADRGDPLMKEAGGSIPYQTDGANSRSSLAIITGKSHGHRPTPSDSSTTHLVKKNGVWSNEPVEMDVIRERSSVKIVPWDDLTPPASNASNLSKPSSSRNLALPKRSSGWSRYWSGGAAGAGAATTETSSRKSVSSRNKHGSSMSTHSRHDCSSHGPTEIPPLQLGQQFDGERINNVVSGSPRLSQGSVDLSRGQSAKFERPATANSAWSSHAPSTLNDTIFTRDGGEETTTWTPVSRSDWTTPRSRDTGSSSIYTDSRPMQQQPELQESSSKLPWKISHPQPIVATEVPSVSNTASQTRASNLTIWPRASIIPVNSDLQPRPTNPNSSSFSSAAYVKQVQTMQQQRDLQYQQQAQAKQQPQSAPTNASAHQEATTDMSWLNLGPVAQK